MGQLGIRAGVKGSFQPGMTKVNQLVKTAEQHSITRLKSASSAIKDGTNVVKNKLARDTVEVARLAETGYTLLKNIFPSRKLGLAMDGMGDVGKIHNPVENTHALENMAEDLLSRINGINLGSGK